MTTAVTVLEALDTAAVRRWSAAAVTRLAVHRDEIDALNVFPVPDSDTGSNLLATVRGADDALRALADPASVGDALSALAGGAARAAVGNSGFLASQLLRGFAETAEGVVAVGAAQLAAGLRAGADLARRAVVAPVEGTLLTVADAAADAADTACGAGQPLARLAAAVVDAARAALARTTGQLPDLARHGVVDAGGRGLVVLLETLSAVVSGTPATGTDAAPAESPSPSAAGHDGDGSGYAYEVQYLLANARGEEPVDPVDLRDALAAIGDSVAVVPVTADTCKVHVHVDDVGAAIEAGIARGRIQQIEVVSFAEQRRTAARAGDTGRTAVVAIAPGAGLAHLFEAEGVHAPAADGAIPTEQQVLDAIRATGAREIVLLPNAAVATGVAEAAARRARSDGRRVAVVPTRSPVQGLAAIAVHDAGRPFDDDVVAMAEAAAATRVAELSIAAEQALTAVGVCQPGDVLGMIDGEVVEVGRGMLAVAFGLVDRLLGVGAELMTIVVGDGAPRRAGELLEAHIRGRAPLTDVTVYPGGQPDHPVIIGAE